ncbi:MAG: sigma-70 family RNA polymerase sigma factor [Terriglobia bacterium]|nr:sigma-70 family RNA polymerase sigma factor [Terriglobia bacterium]
MCATSVFASSAGNDEVRDVDQALAGDGKAFDRIMVRWQRPLLSLARRLGHEENRAEDLTQDVFLHAYLALPWWRRESSFGTWLYAIAKNVYLGEHRRARQVEVRLQDLPELRDLRLPDRGLFLDDRDRLVREALLSLPPTYRDVLILYYFNDCGISAIRQKLQLSEGAVKTRLLRGRAILRKKLSPLLLCA